MFVFSFNLCEETGKTKGHQNFNILVGVTNYYIKIWWTKNIGNSWFLICKNNNKPKATFETHFCNLLIPQIPFNLRYSKSCLWETTIFNRNNCWQIRRLYLMFDDQKFAFETHANDFTNFFWNRKLPHTKNINAMTL